MSFRKPCDMPFRKLIPPFTLTVQKDFKFMIFRFLHCMKYFQLRFLAAKWTVKERSNGNVSKKKNRLWKI